MNSLITKLLKEHGADAGEFKPSKFAPAASYGTVSGASAIALWQAVSSRFEKTGIWPIIRGDGSESHMRPYNPAKILADAPFGTAGKLLAKRLKERMESYEDYMDGVNPEMDIETFARKADRSGASGDGQPRRSLERWPKKAPGKHPLKFSSILDVQTAQPLPLVRFALIEADEPQEALAHLGFGGWNNAPDPSLQVAMLREWNRSHGAMPIVATDSVLECVVERPPKTEPEAFALACDQWIFCEDIVSQGTQSVRKLAIEIWRSPQWFFWWD